MKKLIPLLFFCCLLILLTGKVNGQERNLSGIWRGIANTPDGPDSVTCLLTFSNNIITGKITDEYGYFSDSPIRKGKLQDVKISFSATAATPDGNLSVFLSGTIKNDSITGFWEIYETGDRGTWKVRKIKKN